jgi:hypothetical protein
MESKGKYKNWSESLILLQYMKTNPKKERIKQQFNGSMKKRRKVPLTHLCTNLILNIYIQANQKKYG